MDTKMHNDEVEKFEAWFERRKKESWAAALLPGENKPCPQNWSGAYKPYFREAWLARANLAA